jgi:hypothetical protein
MPAKPRTIYLLVFAAMCGLFVFLSTGDRTGEQKALRKHDAPATAHSPSHSAPSGGALPLTFDQRTPTPEISKARTLALLETPIPGPVEFPAQTLAERVTAINQWLAQAGIPRDQLHVAVEARTAPRNLNLLLERFTVEDETPSTVLKYTVGSTRLYFLARAGFAEFADATLVSPCPDAPAADYPIAD